MYVVLLKIVQIQIERWHARMEESSAPRFVASESERGNVPGEMIIESA